jgi:hypothetical protein
LASKTDRKREIPGVAPEGDKQAIPALLTREACVLANHDPGHREGELVRRASQQHLGLSSKDIGHFPDTIPDQQFIQILCDFREHPTGKGCRGLLRKTENEGSRGRRTEC